MLRLLLILLLPFSLKAQSFYKTPSGAKYHVADCRMVKNVSEEISKQRIIELGLQPCKICNPKNVYNAYSSPAGKAKGEDNATVQCKGLTKSGNRCRHMTRIGNGYCFQHQPD